MNRTGLAGMIHPRKAVTFSLVGVLLGGSFLWNAGVHVYTVRDGTSMVRVVTFENTSVSSILQRAGIPALGEDDEVIPDGGTIIPHGEIAVLRAEPVTLTVDDASETMYSTARTVGELLSESGIFVGAEDIVEPNQASPVPYDGDVVVRRTTYAYRTETQTVPYRRVYRNNPYMEVGKSYISVMGQKGTLEKTIKVTKVAKQAVASDVVKTETVMPVVDEVYDVGVAKLDLKPTKSYTMAATAYSNRRSTILDGTDHLYGYSYLWLHYGTCAVDKNVIPMGTVLYIEGYGYAVAADIGGAIRGNRIDLFFNAFSDACRWGLRTVKVHVLPISRFQLYEKLGVTGVFSAR
ncbi:MAG: 3D domain-containing protein [Caldisericota bacterium]|nr:3D domain-containing protein [Caldisericota bacterium]